MNIFAQASNTVSDPVLLGTIGVVTALMAGFFKVISSQTKANEKLSKTMDKMADSSCKVAQELRKGNKEAKERNGHLGEQTEKIAELVIQSKDDIKKLANRNYEATKNIKHQKVEHQVVEHGTVKEQS